MAKQLLKYTLAFTISAFLINMKNPPMRAQSTLEQTTSEQGVSNDTDLTRAKELKEEEEAKLDEEVATVSEAEKLYEEMHLGEKIQKEAFLSAYEGYKEIKGVKKPILTVIDFTLSSKKERFFVIDLNKKKLLLSSVVSHGRGSGNEYATNFSNKSGSNASSPGFYLTRDTYYGGNGYSLNLDGLEEGINDNAYARRVVVHGASYSNPSVIGGLGFLGRSQGCPALPTNIARSTIDLIKNGSVMYIHTNHESYASRTKFKIHV